MSRLLPKDPRYFQIAFLTCFLMAGVAALDFQISFWLPPLLIATACLSQWALTAIFRIPSAGYLSPLITSLGLSLLLRTDSPWVAAMAAFAAIASKFLIRVRGKHVFNPTTFGLCSVMALLPNAWCSPSQWGESALLLAWLAMVGGTVVYRALRSDVSLAFLLSWLGLKAARVLYLGQKLPVFLHQLSVGSLILFAFFMISDPKTTPNHRGARVFFALTVAGVAFFLQHQLWWNNSPIWALLFVSPLTPVLDRLFPAASYQWAGSAERKLEWPPSVVSPLAPSP